MDTDTFSPSGLDLLHLRNTAEAFINSKPVDDATIREGTDFVFAVARAYMTALAYEYFAETDPAEAARCRETVIRNFSAHESYESFVSALTSTRQDLPPRELMFFVQFMGLLHTELCRDGGMWAAARDYASRSHNLKTLSVGYGQG